MKSSQLTDLQRNLKEGTFLWIDEDWNNDPFREFIQHLNAQFENSDIFYNVRNSLAVFHATADNGLKKDVVVKKFNMTKKYDQLRFRFLKSKAVRSLVIATALTEIGLKTPPPVAVVEKRDQRKKIIYSYFLTEYIHHDCSLLDIIRQENHPHRGKFQSLLPPIARDIRKMHDAGIVHNDLHGGNILIKNIEAEPEFYYIDLNRARIKPRLDEKKRIKDLARFEFSLEDQAVFLRHYAPEKHQELLDLLVKMRRKRERLMEYKLKLKQLLK